jgi:hypothetical protein
MAAMSSERVFVRKPEHVEQRLGLFWAFQTGWAGQGVGLHRQQARGEE